MEAVVPWKQETRQAAISINITLSRFRATILTVKRALSITYYEYVFVALDIQHTMRMHRIFICGLPASTIFFHLIS